jgi:hypothetical protein
VIAPGAVVMAMIYAWGKAEQEAAQGGALPMLGADGSQPPSEAKDPAGGVA